MGLNGKVAIVTGGGAGLGRSIAIALAKDGAKVVVADIREDLSIKVASEIEALGGEALSVKVDVRSSAEIEKMVELTLEKFGGIDILVNNAGVLTVAPVVDLTEEEWEYVMGVNAKGTFLCSKIIAKQMIKQGRGGKIVNISSVNGKTGYPFEAHYTASKFAIVGFTMSLAKELAQYKINVNAVCPGCMKTDMHTLEFESWAKLMQVTVEELEKEFLKSIPLGRLAEPEDVAKVVVFLCSDNANYMTGQAINVCGGLEMH
jgi:acetoin reductase-like protein